PRAGRGHRPRRADRVLPQAPGRVQVPEVGRRCRPAAAQRHRQGAQARPSCSVLGRPEPSGLDTPPATANGEGIPGTAPPPPARGADPARLVVAGDSAGGALAAHVAQRLRDAGPRPAALQVLVYPATDFSLSRADRDPRLAKLLDWDTIDWFAQHALPPGVNRQAPGISPSFAADLSGLPPAVILTPGVDPFTSDAIGYGTALSSAGVPV